MKLFSRFLLIALALVSFDAMAQPIPTTAGSNLTAWNGGSGATNNNQWNSLMNNRSGGVVDSAPAADFGNCNALVLRCAQPKCATGGCTSLEITTPIVSGCVMDNETCKKHGDQLIQTIAAQLVASSNAKMQQAQLAAQQAAAQQAAAQNSQQMQQMQAQMQQMQAEMAAQNAATVAQLESALAEQKELNAQAIANAAAAQQAASAQQSGGADTTATTELTQAQIEAAQRGVDADLLAREKITGQIMSKLENAETALKELKVVLDDTFAYAQCDSNGDNCAGPKRVKVFKQKALKFFDPYNDVLDELYDALITAQAVGVDITDIYMMLNGSCNVWGEYLCSDKKRYKYDSDNCSGGRSGRSATTNGGHECVKGQVIPAEDSPSCVLQRTLADQKLVQRNWLDAAKGLDGDMVRVGCASAALESSQFFRGRKKQATIDIETLERIIEQDAPAFAGNSRFNTNKDQEKHGSRYCAIKTEEQMSALEQAANLKKLPKKICVGDDKLTRDWANNGGVGATSVTAGTWLDCSSSLVANMPECICRNSGYGASWSAYAKTCNCGLGFVWLNGRCQVATQENRQAAQMERFMPSTNSVADVMGRDFDKIKCTTVYNARWDPVTNTCDCFSSKSPLDCNKAFQKEFKLTFGLGSLSGK